MLGVAGSGRSGGCRPCPAPAPASRVARTCQRAASLSAPSLHHYYHPPTAHGADSIEDKVLALQERKRGVIAQALEGRGGRVTMEDLAALFEGIA